jgi:GAF domain-containing protein
VTGAATRDLPAEYQAKLVELREAIGAARDWATALNETVRRLRDAFGKYNWVGVYWVIRHQLVLAAWDGPEPTEHVRIPIGTGICGLAAESGETVVVPDVSKEPRYLACFPYTRSEIVVPIKRDGRVLGEIDIDSNVLDAFGPEDRVLLEAVAALLAEKYPGD